MNNFSLSLKKTIAHLCVLAFVFALSAFVANAQNAPTDADDEPDFIVPARPTFSNPAEFQRPGVLQIEYGYNGNYHAKGVGAAHDTPLAARFAASRRVLFEFDADSPISQKVNGSERETGIGDFFLGSQIVLHHENKRAPGVAFAYYIKLPAASSARGLGTGRVDHNFIALISKNIKGTTFDFNAIYLLAGRTSNNSHASSGQAALAASRNITKRVGIQGEISGYSRNDQQAGAIFTLGVVPYQVNRRLVFDGGIRAGLTRDAPRVGAVAGMTIGVADLYKRHCEKESADEH